MQLERLREWRESHGLTQRELASEAGVGEVTVARVEAGTSVRPNTARKLADVLGVTVADLMERPPVPLGEGGASEVPPTPPTGEGDLLEFFKSGASGSMLVLSRGALIEALEHVRDGVWSVEDAERVLEREGFLWEREEVTGEEFFEQMRKRVGKWSTS